MKAYTYETYTGKLLTVTKEEVVIKFGGEAKFFSRNFIVQYWVSQNEK